MKNALTRLLILCLPFLAYSCSSVDSSNSADSNLLDGTWSLVTMKSDNFGTWNPLKEEEGSYQISFNKEITGMTVIADCNTCGGEVQVNSTNIEIVLLCTRAVCGNSGNFSSALSASSDFDISNNILIMRFYNDTILGSGVLEFRKLITNE